MTRMEPVATVPAPLLVELRRREALRAENQRQLRVAREAVAHHEAVALVLADEERRVFATICTQLGLDPAGEYGMDATGQVLRLIHEGEGT